jgi:hypothetical protein
MSERERYLGDGLYVSFDGFGFKLRAPREGADHWVYLEPLACAEFARFVEEMTKAKVSKSETFAIREVAHRGEYRFGVLTDLIADGERVEIFFRTREEALVFVAKQERAE